MDKQNAEEHFRDATEWFNAGEYDRALYELAILEEDYPDNHRILNAKARTLYRLMRYGEALALCARLLDEFGYEKVRPLQMKILDQMDALDAQEGQSTKPIPLPSSDTFDLKGNNDDEAMWDD